MGGMIGALRDATVRPFQDAVARLAADTATGLAIVLLASLGIGFAIAAAWVWLAGHLGALAACGVLAGVFLGLAGTIVAYHQAVQSNGKAAQHQLLPCQRRARNPVLELPADTWGLRHQQQPHPQPLQLFAGYL